MQCVIITHPSKMEAGLSLSRGARLTNTLQSSWEIASQWVGPREVYPEETPELAAVLTSLSSARIERADVGYKGTQLKALLVLDGGQKVVFKPKRSGLIKKKILSDWFILLTFVLLFILFLFPPSLRYNRDYVVEGEPYAGYDRHNAEVAAFHLDRFVIMVIWVLCHFFFFKHSVVCRECHNLQSCFVIFVLYAGSLVSGEHLWWLADTSICELRSNLWPQTNFSALFSCRVSICDLLCLLSENRIIDIADRKCGWRVDSWKFHITDGLLFW